MVVGCVDLAPSEGGQWRANVAYGAQMPCPSAAEPSPSAAGKNNKTTTTKKQQKKRKGGQGREGGGEGKIEYHSESPKSRVVADRTS